MLLTTEALSLFQLGAEVPINAHVWWGPRFALQRWQTKRHSNAEVRVNTRQTGCQHSGLITVSMSPVSVIPWHSSLQEILFYTRAFPTFYILCNPIINDVQVVIHTERNLNSVVPSFCHIENTIYHSITVYCHIMYSGVVFFCLVFILSTWISLLVRLQLLMSWFVVCSI